MLARLFLFSAKKVQGKRVSFLPTNGGGFCLETRPFSKPCQVSFTVSIMRLLDDFCQSLLYTIFMFSQNDTEVNKSTATKDIGTRIALIRKSKGLTQANLADRIGVSRLLISDYERGKVRIYADVLAKIAAALGVSADTLLKHKELQDTMYLPSLKIAKRMQAMEKLSDNKQKAILKTLDDLILANQDR